MKKILLKTIIFLLLPVSLFSQNDFWIFFTDKQGVTFDPYSYFDPLAIERRVKQGIPLEDFTDFPLVQSYVDAVSQSADEYIGQSRWFNAVAVSATSEQLSQITDLPFVKDIKPVYSALSIASESTTQSECVESESDSSSFVFLDQIKRMSGELFYHANINGKGIRIAVLDGGFTHVDTHKAFCHLRDSNRIVKVWNFARKNEKVYRDHAHGRMVLSCISGRYDDVLLGLATEAEILLAKTETAFELKREEIWWMEAVEWADRNGTHIINSSLGYTGSRYTPEDMNGQKSIISRAANMAASKGILVVNAAGNSGNDKEWLRMIATPADADSVLTVGGVNPFTDYRISFSSMGPTYDNRLKPNVSAHGWATVAARSELTYGATGTSFASPLVAGFAACVWQLHPEWNVMKLKEEIEKSADLYPYFDYDLGYGVPQASYFLEDTVKRFSDYAKFEMIEEEDKIRLQISTDRLLIKNEEYQTKFKNINYLFCHIQDENGVLQKYFVFDCDLHTYKYQYEKEEPFEGLQMESMAEPPPAVEPELLEEPVVKSISIDKSDLKPGYVVRARYNGVSKEFRVE